MATFSDRSNVIKPPGIKKLLKVTPKIILCVFTSVRNPNSPVRKCWRNVMYISTICISVMITISISFTISSKNALNLKTKKSSSLYQISCRGRRHNARKNHHLLLKKTPRRRIKNKRRRSRTRMMRKTKSKLNRVKKRRRRMMRMRIVREKRMKRSRKRSRNPRRISPRSISQLMRICSKPGCHIPPTLTKSKSKIGFYSCRRPI